MAECRDCQHSDVEMHEAPCRDCKKDNYGRWTPKATGTAKLSHRGLSGEFVPDGAESFVKIVDISDFITARVDDGADMVAVFRELVDDYLETRAALKDDSKQS